MEIWTLTVCTFHFIFINEGQKSGSYQFWRVLFSLSLLKLIDYEIQIVFDSKKDRIHWFQVHLICSKLLVYCELYIIVPGTTYYMYLNNLSNVHYVYHNNIWNIFLDLKLL